MRYDLITMGRSSIDLYAQQIGKPFEEVSSFGAYVGGCPTNIAVGARRLGLRSALLTGVGDDPVGDFVLRFLRQEGVDVQYVARKAGKRTSAVLLAIQPPDRFPLVFYRDNCADIALDEADVAATPIEATRALVVTGTGLSQAPSRDATREAVAKAKAAGVLVVLDIDLRLDQWPEPEAFGPQIAALLPSVDLAIGTEEEIKAAASVGQARVQDSQQSSPVVGGELGDAVRGLLQLGLGALVVKRGREGARAHLASGEVVDAPGYEVEVLNVLGAGDGFAAGLLYGRLHGWSWARSLAMGNAVGAIVVTKPGCANFMPAEPDALAFLEARQG